MKQKPKPPPLDLVILARALDRFGQPEFEHRFDQTRRWRFDMAWPALLVAFEREGGTWQRGRHTSGIGFRNDCEKYNSAAARGWCVIRATVDMIESGLALDQLEQALQARTVCQASSASAADSRTT